MADEFAPKPLEGEPRRERDPEDAYRTSRVVSITAIIACSVVVLTCIVAVTVLAAIFFMNAPWGW